MDNFLKDLYFGTGGIRGIMGEGNNFINKKTITIITLGLIKYLKKKYFRKKIISIVIAYDVRKNSDIFAHTVASIFSSENIIVYIFNNFRPTPELSYAVCKLKCQAGIMITASHNPPEYNGYKIYSNDGSQIVYPEDILIMNEIKNINLKNYILKKSNDKIIYFIGDEIDNKFINDCIKHTSFHYEGRESLNIIFTPLHGTSIHIFPKALRKAGFKKIFIVKEQSIPDYNFSTVKSPNPEESESFSMALSLSKIHKADIILASDPDGDRFGVAVLDEKNNIIILNGNQVNTLLIYYILKYKKEKGLLNNESFIISTLVSSDIFINIANIFNIKCLLSLTGFKWIAKLIRDSKKKENFIGAGEESFGFMIGNFLLDKDAITSLLLISEIAAYFKNKGSSIYKELLFIYTKTGYFQEFLYSYKEQNDVLKILKRIQEFRENPPIMIGTKKIIYIEDYQNKIKLDLINKTKIKLRFPKSNILIFRLEDNIKIAIRPSGTEPKIKLYISVNMPLLKIENYPIIQNIINIKIQNIFFEFKKILFNSK